MKEKINKIKKRINKLSLVKLIKFRSTIKDLNEKIEGLEKDKQELNDKITGLDLKLKELKELENKVPSMELIIESSDASLKEKMQENNKLKEDILKLKNELFDAKHELASANIQKQEYEAQIKDLKSDRYLIKKVPSGRKPNTNKTKISRPMSSRVTKYMRGEHE